MNLVLAVAIFLGVAMTFGFATQTTEVAGVQKCVISQSENRDTCKTGDPVSPAQAAGLQKGDKIVAFNGEPVADWTTLSNHIRETIGPATITVERDGKQQVLHGHARQEHGRQEGRRRRGRPRQVRRRPAISASPRRPRSCRSPSPTPSTAWAT